MSKDYSVDVGKIDDVDQQNGKVKVMKRVLIVDDEESIRDMLTEVLVAEKYEVVQAPSGEEALDLFRDDPFPLVITDIRMGGMNGFELLDEIKQLAAETHVVIMTSHASMDSAITALKGKAYDYIIKPLEDLRLITSVARRAIENVALIKERKSLMENLKNSNERLEELAIRDGLTGLYNHRHLYEALTREVARATRFNVSLSVIFLDVDFFKKYNDTYGHQSGDQVLKTISQILLDNTRQIDIAARYGGEEFVVILPGTSKDEGYLVAEKIRKAVADRHLHDPEGQPSTKVTISAGIASLGEDGTGGAELINSADQAVYQAKKAGRNTVCLAG